jgi:hypothetical protein
VRQHAKTDTSYGEYYRASSAFIFVVSLPLSPTTWKRLRDESQGAGGLVEN